MNQQNKSQQPTSRRVFLAGSAAAAVGGAFLAGATRAQDAQAERAAPRQKRPWKKAFYGGVDGQTLLDQYKTLKAAGFDGVEINSPGPKRDEVISALKESGLECAGVVDGVHWETRLTDADPKRRAAAVEFLKGALRDCQAYGGTSVLLVPGRVDKAVSYDDAYKRSQEEIRKAIPVAQETGVKIAIENVWNDFLLSPIEAARYIDEFESPWVVFHFDIGNVVTYGWAEQWIRILGKRIFKLHIKDFSRKKRNDEGLFKGFGVKLMEGDNDWPAIMKALDEVGYSGGWACAEVAGGSLENLKDVAARLDRILAS
jgi:L-ribulose-5-phosphate 3-epimerase